MSRAIFGDKAACNGDGCSREARAAGLALMERYFKLAEVVYRVKRICKLINQIIFQGEFIDIVTNEFRICCGAILALSNICRAQSQSATPYRPKTARLQALPYSPFRRL